MKNGAAKIRVGAPSPLFEQPRDLATIAFERLRLNRELRKLSEFVIEAQEAERRRIARDLHESVNQILSSVAFRLGMIEAQIPAENKAIKEEMDRAKALLTQGIDEVQRISDGLRPSELDALGLVPAVRGLCREFERKTKLPLSFECNEPAQRLTDAMELTLYRIVQEALSNIERHSGASQASLRLQWSAAFINLVIHDNGRGLEPPTGRNDVPPRWGLGLLNMRERAAFLGGTFSIQSIRGQGTDLVVRIPLGGLAGRMESEQ